MLDIPKKLIHSDFPSLDKIFHEQITTTIDKLRLEKHKNIEVELRIGQIRYIDVQERISLSVMHPVIYNKTMPETKFVSQVESNFYDHLYKFFDQEDSTKQTIKDTVFIHKTDRIIKNENGTEICIKKQNKLTLNIYMPNSTHDFRLSINVEEELNKKHVNDKLISTRQRERNSFLRNGFRFDFTKVKIGAEQFSEIEVEMVDLQADVSNFVKLINGMVEKK